MEETKHSFSQRAREIWGAVKNSPSWLEAIEGLIWSHADESHGFKDFVKRHLQILDSSIRSFRAHDSMTKASALTYTSILTMVPLLALVVTVVKYFDLFQGMHTAINNMLNQMLTTAGATADAKETITGSIVDRIFEIVQATDFSKLGFGAVIGLLLAVMSLMSRVEVAMNDVWSVHKSRPFGRKIADYINMVLVLALMLIATSGAAGSTIVKFSEQWSQLNKLQGLLLGFMPYMIIWLAFIFLFHSMPNTRVRWRSAIVSGMIAGILFQLLQIGFFAMAGRTIDRYRQIYDAAVVRDAVVKNTALVKDAAVNHTALVKDVAVKAVKDANGSPAMAFWTILFLLFWIWFSWCIVLWGVEFCNAHQNIRDWRRRRRPWHNTPAERETLALRMAAVLAAPMLEVDRDEAPMDTGELSDELKLPSEPVGEMLDLFENNGLVKRTDEGTFVFVRSPERVSMLDIVRLVRHGKMHHAPKGQELMNEGLTSELRGRTVKDLAGQPIDSIHTYSI